MRIFFLFLLITCYSFVNGQFYYSDLMGLQQTQKNYEILRKNRIKEISGTGTAAEGAVKIQTLIEVPTDGKRIVKSISENNRTKELVKQYFEMGRLKKIIIHNPGVKTAIEYQYNGKGLLSYLASTVKDSSSGSSITETHHWEYNNNGSPKKMIKKTTGMDSLSVEFLTDSIGLVLEEGWFKKDKKIETFYYYYLPENRLSDIVKFNTKAQKLLPDFVFEYDQKGQLTKMIQVGNNGRNITYWDYSYFSNGLRETEIARDRNKNLIISTQYQFEKH